jgi:hypothetical protein
MGEEKEEKIEERLREEMQRMEKTNQGNRETPVLIELEAIPGVGQGGVQALDEKVKNAQQEVRRKLEELGAGESIRAMTLANAMEARLTPSGIRQVATLHEVKKILWNRVEQVTA